MPIGAGPAKLWPDDSKLKWGAWRKSTGSPELLTVRFMDLWLIGELLAVGLLIALCGCLSGAEIALISANRTELKQLADGGSLRAQIALDLAQNPSQFLPAVQLAVSGLNTLAAVLAGLAAADLVALRVMARGSEIVTTGSMLGAVGIAVVGCSLLAVTFGELLPRRLVAAGSTTLACRVARPLAVLSRSLKPLVWLLAALTDGLALMFGAAKVEAASTSLQEIRHLIELGTAEGLVGEVEQRLAFEALQLGDRTARQIMKPRVDIDAVDVETPPEELLGTIAMAGFSRLPVYEGDLDHIIGFVHLKDVLRQQYLGWRLNLRKLIRPALTVPDTMRLDKLLVTFQEQRNQLAIIVDEFGATRGMVTLEDVLEELVGEMLTEHHQRSEDQIVQRDAATWLVDGSVSLIDLLERLNLQHHVPDAPRHVSSVGGLVLDLLGHIPKVGEKADWHEMSLEVVDLDGRRIDQILITVRPQQKKP
ncbi:MAG: HlyC/CorC family transporter [Planctomycetes bacterium]|nr:HlyC/CorC family transporter [Planctomycetota bacterium]